MAAVYSSKFIVTFKVQLEKKDMTLAPFNIFIHT